MFLYFAEVGDADRVGKGGGIDDEDIKVLEIGLEELFERLARGLIEDAKLAIGAYWLQGRMARRREPRAVRVPRSSALTS